MVYSSVMRTYYNLHYIHLAPIHFWIMIRNNLHKFSVICTLKREKYQNKLYRKLNLVHFICCKWYSRNRLQNIEVYKNFSFTLYKRIVCLDMGTVAKSRGTLAVPSELHLDGYQTFKLYQWMNRTSNNVPSQFTIQRKHASMVCFHSCPPSSSLIFKNF